MRTCVAFPKVPTKNAQNSCVSLTCLEKQLSAGISARRAGISAESQNPCRASGNPCRILASHTRMGRFRLFCVGRSVWSARSALTLLCTDSYCVFRQRIISRNEGCCSASFPAPCKAFPVACKNLFAASAEA